MRRLALYSTLTIVVAVTLACAFGPGWAASAEQPSIQATSAPVGQAAAAAAQPKKAAPKAPPRVRVYNTGDYDAWPSLNLPIVYRIEVPEVPKGIVCPSVPIAADAE